MQKDFFDKLKNSLTPNDIIKFMAHLGAQTYRDTNDYIVFPTICHNADVSQASMKLYYYKSNKLFHCYTDCSESFDIWGLIRRYTKTRNITPIPWHQYIDLLVTQPINFKNIEFGNMQYQSLSEIYQKPKKIELKTLNAQALSPFVKYYTEEWLTEGITPQAMNKYNILYSIIQNKIIIPHYNENNELVGIRGRALNEEDIQGGKYKPITIENITYAHPLSLNLYGLNLNKDNIRNKHCAIVFEGEKSVLLMDGYYPINISVASCGSNFHKAQLKLLLNYDVTEIILAFDKENTTKENSEKYFNKLYNMCEKYKNYCNLSFIYDRENLLEAKDSPIDKGKDIFEYLLNKRVKL